MSVIREYLDTQDEDFLLLGPEAYDTAIVGLVDRPEGGRAVCYDVEKVLEVLMADGMDEEGAQDFFDFNIAGAFLGENSPVFLERVPRL